MTTLESMQKRLWFAQQTAVSKLQLMILMQNGNEPDEKINPVAAEYDYWITEANNIRREIGEQK